MVRKTNLPGLSIPNSIDTELRIALESIVQHLQVRSAIGSNTADRFVTERELTTAGYYDKGSIIPPGVDADSVIGIIESSSDAPILTTPPAPTGLSAVGAITTVILSWDNPNLAYDNHGQTEIWRAGVDDLGVAVLQGTSTSFVVNDTVGTDSTHYYWVRHISDTDVPGPFNATSGTLGQTGFILPDNIGALAITAAKLADDSVINAKLGVDAVTATKIQDLAVGVAAIANLAVTTAKIDNLAITNAKIALLAVDNAQIADATITTAKIGLLQVTNALIQSLDADKINATYLSSIVADLGTITAGNITLDASGFIRGGQTAYNAGTGFWFGRVSGTPKFSIGNGLDKGIVFDGVNASLLQGTQLHGSYGYNNGSIFKKIIFDSFEKFLMNPAAEPMTITADGMEIDLRSNAGVVEISKSAKYTLGDYVWTKGRRLRLAFSLEAASLVSTDKFFFRSGAGSWNSVDSGDSYIGMRTEGSTVYGNWSDGLALTEVTLTTTVSPNTEIVFEVVYDGSTGVIEFYVNGTYQVGKDLTASSLVADRARWEMQLWVVNQSASTGVNFVLGEAEFLQEYV